MSTGTPISDLFSRTDLRRQLERAHCEAAPPVACLGPVPDVGPIAGGDVVATMVLWSPTWDDEALRRLREELAASRNRRRLIFVEPTATSGWRRLVQLALGPILRRRLGHDFTHDVPVALRRAGFAIDTLDRFRVGPGGVRSYVRGVASADLG